MGPYLPVISASAERGRMVEMRREHVMVPAEATLEYDEVFDAFEKANGCPLTISKRGHRSLTVIDPSVHVPEEPKLTPEQIDLIKQGFEDCMNGNSIPLDDAIAELRKKYGQ